MIEMCLFSNHKVDLSKTKRVFIPYVLTKCLKMKKADRLLLLLNILKH